MHVAEVVEILCLARRAGIVGDDALLDAALAVVGPTANHLARISQHLGADLADELLRDLAGKLVGWTIMVHLGDGVVHGDDL